MLTRPSKERDGLCIASLPADCQYLVMADPRPGNATLTVMPASPGWIATARIYHAILAAIGTLAVATDLIMVATEDQNGSWFNGVLFMLSALTIWANILVAIVAWSLVINPHRDGRIFRWLRMTTLVMIFIVGLVFDLVLAKEATPCGVYVYTNLAVHYIVPWGTLLGFLIFGPRPRFTADLIWKMPLIPTIWLAYTFAHGAVLTTPPGQPCAANPAARVLGQPQNWYPYPFVDPDYNGTGEPISLVPGVSAEGFAGVAVNLAAIIAVGLLVSWAFLGLDRALSRGKRPIQGV